MDLDHDAPLRCPKCNALVVERRSPTCTTCHAALPPEWVLSREETAHLTAMDDHAKFKHAQSMERLSIDPDKPEIERIGEATEE
jgi:hypothetical protein